MTAKIREHYLAAILRQNIAYFDVLGAGEVTTRITAETNTIQDGLSEKVALTLTAFAGFVTAFVVAYVLYWKLALILTSTIVAIFTCMSICTPFIVKFAKANTEAYAKGGSVAEEVLSSIRNAVAFGTQEKLATQYGTYLIEAEKHGRKQKSLVGILIGCLMGFVYLNYGLSFWQGSRFLVWGDITLSHVVTILLAVIIGAFNLGNVAPNIQAFTSAISAGGKIFSTIDRVSPLDPSSKEGKKLEEVIGDVELRNIKHIYPSRPEVTVMDGVNLKVPAGKTTALVGASGSGKSTIVGLVERFYDPVNGSVFFDGYDVKDLNLRWLRQQISLVSQEPTLFGTTIYGNIAHGLIGSKYENESEQVQTEMIEKAAKMANAHDFITNLPEGYDTNVGERGFLLSGGQKQRIAIARAMVCDPKVLLLDEATSALDTKSEGVVQAALDVAAKGRTTIVIAHRLSTIKTADNIVVMSQGKIIEQGTHDQLLENKDAYYSLVEAQRISAEQQKGNEITVEMDEAGSFSQSYSGSEEKGQPPVDPDDEKMRKGMTRTNTQKSISSAVLKDKKSEEAPKYSLWTLIKLIAGYNRKELHLMLIGLFGSIIAGGGQPVQAVFFAKAITALALPPEYYDRLRSQANFWSLMYLMLGIVTFLSYCTLMSAFAVCSERLVYRARDTAFRAMLRQDIAFFDKEENSAGALTSFLSTESSHLAGISGSSLGTILTVVTTLCASILIGLSIGWKLTLVCVSTVPILLASGYYRFAILARFQEISKKSFEGSASYACEATSAIRTVASLTREEDVWEHFHESLAVQGRKSLISVSKSSTLYAASQSFVFLCLALGFWYGGKLLATREYSTTQFFICFTGVIFSAQSAGSIFSFAPDMGKAKHAASQLKTLLDRKPAIDTWSQDGEKVQELHGSIEFRDVHFRYPTRPEQPVLRGLSLTVKPGQYVALVGQSGCGKSTTIALLERFYDPLSGGIFVDGKEISSLNVNEYRAYLALVSQEPTLYQGSIRDNVLLGIVGANATITEEAIVQACKDANIYDFIMSLPYVFHSPSLNPLDFSFPLHSLALLENIC